MLCNLQEAFRRDATALSGTSIDRVYRLWCGPEPPQVQLGQPMVAPQLDTEYWMLSSQYDEAGYDYTACTPCATLTLALLCIAVVIGKILYQCGRLAVCRLARLTQQLDQKAGAAPQQKASNQPIAEASAIPAGRGKPNDNDQFGCEEDPGGSPASQDREQQDTDDDPAMPENDQDAIDACGSCAGGDRSPAKLDRECDTNTSSLGARPISRQALVPVPQNPTVPDSIKVVITPDTEVAVMKCQQQTGALAVDNTPKPRKLEQCGMSSYVGAVNVSPGCTTSSRPTVVVCGQLRPSPPDENLTADLGVTGGPGGADESMPPPAQEDNSATPPVNNSEVAAQESDSGQTTNGEASENLPVVLAGCPAPAPINGSRDVVVLLSYYGELWAVDANSGIRPLEPSHEQLGEDLELAGLSRQACEETPFELQEERVREEQHPAVRVAGFCGSMKKLSLCRKSTDLPPECSACVGGQYPTTQADQSMSPNKREGGWLGAHPVEDSAANLDHLWPKGLKAMGNSGDASTEMPPPLEQDQLRQESETGIMDSDSADQQEAEDSEGSWDQAFEQAESSANGKAVDTIFGSLMHPPDTEMESNAQSHGWGVTDKPKILIRQNVAVKARDTSGILHSSGQPLGSQRAVGTRAGAGDCRLTPPRDERNPGARNRSSPMICNASTPIQRMQLRISVPEGNLNQARGGQGESQVEVLPREGTPLAEASVSVHHESLEEATAANQLTRQRSSGEASSLSCATVRSEPSADSARSRAFFPPENDSARSRAFFPPDYDWWGLMADICGVWIYGV